MTKISQSSNFNKLHSWELTSRQQELVDAAKKATLQAYAPYSNFQVGAAVLLDNGEIITGSNQENVAYPSGLCAERVALFYAHHLYPKAKVRALAIAASDHEHALKYPITPCGACVQVISESITRSGEAFEILLQGEGHLIHIPSALDLIPFRFSIHND